MKKLIALALASTMLFSLASCAGEEAKKTEDNAEVITQTQAEETKGEEKGEEGTVGETLLADFKANKDGTAQEIAEKILENPILQFMSATMPVEEGFLNGFNEEIKGFKEGVTFGPVIGSIPFVGYIFTLEDGSDVESFKTTLKDNANLRWNICVSADEMVVENEGNTVFFLMCPASFEQEEPATEEVGDMGVGDMGVGDMDMPAADGTAAEDGIVLE